ncbi:MAG TPA: right-handed parallel beta-helix repeat-containing protein, partial [Candidatus Paceibacterota bacterium]|nr:right-handed parallel beta-helix repeat-containing protein [Candidatus Paceibacterota bacterium]
MRLTRVMRRGAFSLAVSVLALLSIPASAAAATYYVATNGSDSNSGTSVSSPFKTMQHAADLTNPGDTVYVRGGTYTFSGSSDALTISRSGDASGVITYAAYPGETPVIQFGGGAWEGINIRASYIDVNGFTVIGPAQSYASKGWAGTNSPGTSSGTGNEACIVAGYYNASGPFYTHITVENNTVSYCSETGIQALHADYLTIKNNIAHDNSWYSPYAGSGISVYETYNSDSNTGTKISITGNITYNNIEYVGLQGGSSISDGEGIIIDDNKWSQHSGSAYTGRTLVANNVSYGNGGPGIEAFQSQHVDIVNNTVYQNQKNHSGNDGDLAPSVASDINLTNNISVPMSGKKANASGSGFTYSHNLYYGSTATTGTGDITGDPLFVSPGLTAGANFQLRSGSPAIGAGTSLLAPLTDILGITRSTNGYDIGAYEYSGSGGGTVTP